MDTILIIEDYEEIRSSLRDILISEGYAVLEASGGAQGLAHCRDTSIAVVITDILMPNTDGMELISELRKNLPHTPIIAISGGGCMNSEDCLTLAERAGAAQTFSKPFQVAEILNAVKKLCA